MKHFIVFPRTKDGMKRFKKFIRKLDFSLYSMYVGGDQVSCRVDVTPFRDNIEIERRLIKLIKKYSK